MTHSEESISRRKFLERAGACAAGASVLGLASCSSSPDTPAGKTASTLPVRTLGKTGLEVSLLTFGGGSQFLMNEDGDWEPILERAVAEGITLFDTASTYRWGATMSSEERFGRILPAYRDRILLSTKFNERDPDAAKAEIEQSLKWLKTDYVDILMIHSVEESEDLDAFEKGMYQEMLKLKEQGVARFIGFSSMNSAQRSRELLERLDLDVALLAMNPTKYGDFAETALPVAREKNVGVLAMKVMRDIVGKDATPTELLQYAWTQEGVATAAVGHYGMKVFEENLQITRDFTSVKTASLDHRELERRLAPLAGPHQLCWARPGYRDGDWA